MAGVYEHPKSGFYHVAFWYEGTQYRKSLKTRNRRQAEDDAMAVQRAVDALIDGRDKVGLELIGRGVSIVDVVFPTAAVKELLDKRASKPILLGELTTRWLDHQRAQGRTRRHINFERFSLGPYMRVLGENTRGSARGTRSGQLPRQCSHQLFEGSFDPLVAAVLLR